MQKKTLGIFAAAAIALGAAGFATSANASIASAGRAPAATKDANVQLAGHYYGYYAHRRHCRRLYRRGFVHGYRWARRAYYRNGCHRRYYRPYYGRPAYTPGFGIYFGF